MPRTDRYSPDPKPGDRVVIRLGGSGKQEVIITFLVPMSLRLKQADGTEVVVSRDKVRRQLNIVPSPAKRAVRP